LIQRRQLIGRTCTYPVQQTRQRIPPFFHPVPMSLLALPDDILLAVLLLGDARRDLHATILSCRRLWQTYKHRESLVISSVVLREVRRQCTTQQQALAHADGIVASLQATPNPETTLLVYQALSPVLTSASPSHSPTFYRWIIKLCRAAAAVGPSAADRRLAWLQQAYSSIASLEPNFHPEDVTHTHALLSRSNATRLTRDQQSICRTLADEYMSRGHLKSRLDVQKTAIQRLPPKDSDSTVWAGELAKTYSALQDREAALAYERQLYAVCKSNNHLDASLTWARLIVAEYASADRTLEAISAQITFLKDLRPGTPEHIAWARHLITMQKRAGLTAEALATKHSTWRQMNVGTACCFGWARELADEYRKIGHHDQALSVIRGMHEAAARALTRHPRDNSLKFHANHAKQALIMEYEYRGESSEAETIRSSSV
jgi:tetratricopeptide (TPR) repeat protein